MKKKKEKKVEETEIKTKDEPASEVEKVEKPSEPRTPKALSPSRKKNKKSRGASYEKQLAKVNPNRLYPIAQAIKLSKETSYSKFNATIEAHFNLGIDTSKDDQKVRTTLVMPSGTGKEKKILTFVSVDATKSAREAGADFIGDDAKIEEIAKGTIDFDVIVADPDFMPRLSKVAKILGPKGLMPNPKSGTVTSDPIKAIQELKKGRVELRTETSAPLLHTVIGKKSFEERALLENFMAVYNTLKDAKPAKTKGIFIQGISLSATMGPGIRVDLTTIP